MVLPSGMVCIDVLALWALVLAVSKGEAAAPVSLSIYVLTLLVPLKTGDKTFENWSLIVDIPEKK